MDSAIPDWGFRAHGLIEYGEVQLDGRRTQFRQPAGRSRWDAGRTSLIDFGAKEKAILSGDQVHGQRINADSWLYKAPDSSVWVVSVDTSRNAMSVQFDRFGEFVVLPESYSYTVQRPSTGGNRYMRYDVSPSGSAAVFCVMSGPNIVGWDEIVLSGMPDSCEITAAVLFDLNQTSGSVTESDTLQTISYGLYRRISGQFPPIFTTDNLGDDCKGSLTTSSSFVMIGTPADVQYPEDGWHAGISVNGSVIGKSEGAILAVYYAPSGEKKEVTGGIQVETIVTGSVAMTSNGSSSVTKTGTGEFFGPDRNVCSTTTSVTNSPLTTIEKRNTEIKVTINIGKTTHETWVKIEKNTTIRNHFTDDPPVVTGRTEFSSGYVADSAISAVAQLGTNGVSAYIGGWRDSDGSSSELYLTVATLSNAVLAVQASEVKALGATIASYGPVFARGVDRGLLITKRNSGDLPWVSYNPITGAIAFNHNTPVSWT